MMRLKSDQRYIYMINSWWLLYYLCLAANLHYNTEALFTELTHRGDSKKVRRDIYERFSTHQKSPGFIVNTDIYDIMKLNKRFFFLNCVKQAKRGEKLVLIPPMTPKQIKDLFHRNRSFYF